MPTPGFRLPKSALRGSRRSASTCRRRRRSCSSMSSGFSEPSAERVEVRGACDGDRLAGGLRSAFLSSPSVVCVWCRGRRTCRLVDERVRELPAAQAQGGDQQRGHGPLQRLAGAALAAGAAGSAHRLGGRAGRGARAAVGALLVRGALVLGRGGERGLRRADAGHRADRLDQLLRRGARRLLAGGGGAVVDERAHGELGQPAVDAGPHLVGGDEADALGQPGQAVRVVLVRPALGERGVQQGADRLGVGALRGVGADAAQGGVHGEAADAVLPGRACAARRPGSAADAPGPRGGRRPWPGRPG